MQASIRTTSLELRRLLAAAVAGSLIVTIAFYIDIILYNWTDKVGQTLHLWLGGFQTPGVNNYPGKWYSYHLIDSLAIGFVPAMIGCILTLVVYRYSMNNNYGTKCYCRKCGYTLKNLSQPRCPKCGESI